MAGGPTSEDKYDEEYVISIIAEHKDLNAKFRSLFVSQSQCEENTTEDKTNTSDAMKEKKNDQSQSHRTFQNKNHANKTQECEKFTSGSLI